MRVLIVEDEAQLAATIVRVLRRQGIAADAAHDGDAAITRLARDVYDVVVLDRNLPGMSGDEVCRRLVARGGQPRILMLTARDAVSERVAGLDLGADDYVPKPVTMAELVARIRALARRPEASLAPILRWGDLTLDSGRRVATRRDRPLALTRRDRPLALTRRELAVLEELMRAQGAVVSADRLLSRAWDDSYGDPFENTVRVTVMHQVQMQALAADGITVLVPPDANKRQGTRPGWNGGFYAFMRRVLATPAGAALYPRRSGMIEPVFADTKFNRKIDRFLRRGRAACRSEWRLITATHNLRKLHQHRLASAA